MKTYTSNSWRVLLILLCSVVFLSSCSKDDDPPPPGEISEIDYQVEDAIATLQLTFDPNQLADISGNLAVSWSTTSSLISITNANSPKAYVVYPDINEPEEVTIKFSVAKGSFTKAVEKNVTLPKLTEVRKFGIGKELQAEKSNNVSYDWYIDQGYTGTYSGLNCGPASVTMAIKWVDESFSKTTEDARHALRPQGGWCYTSDLIQYLNNHQISNYTVALSNVSDLNQYLDAGNIMILCLDMFYIRNEQQANYHVDKFYATNSAEWGHFIVVKGYKKVDNNVFYEVYDPYSFGKKYDDNAIKGKDRYYRHTDLNKAVTVWWSYAIIVPKEGGMSAFKSDMHKVDPTKIEHKYGGVIE
ncbi:MAG: C39 family peptidase [Prevotellaceae bacterium]|jgi:hypothetical protein|nr:C39 family peptidase [Prevotellaceae bacterium]